MARAHGPGGWKDDDMPAFLRRAPTPEGAALAARIVREATTPREITMPTRERPPRPETADQEQSKEETLAKIDALIANRDAPVEVWTEKPGDPKDVHVHKRLGNMAEFEAWFDPKAWRYLGTRNDLNVTAIMLDGAGGSRGVTTKVRAKVDRAVDAGGVAVGYIVNSHIGLALKRHGFRRVAGAAPMLFRHAAGHEVAVSPPAPDKKSSSDWVLRLAGEPERGGRGMSIDAALKGAKL